MKRDRESNDKQAGAGASGSLSQGVASRPPLEAPWGHEPERPRSLNAVSRVDGVRSLRTRWAIAQQAAEVAQLEERMAETLEAPKLQAKPKGRRPLGDLFEP